MTYFEKNMISSKWNCTLEYFKYLFVRRTIHVKFKANIKKSSLYDSMKQKRKNKYDPKIETVKYLVLFDQNDQNKSWLIFNTASKVCKFPGLVSIHLIFNAILLKLQITTVRELLVYWWRRYKAAKKCCYRFQPYSMAGLSPPTAQFENVRANLQRNS